MCICETPRSNASRFTRTISQSHMYKTCISMIYGYMQSKMMYIYILHMNESTKQYPVLTQYTYCMQNVNPHINLYIDYCEKMIYIEI